MPHLILPVENQVRELDPKLLLACVAAERGLPALLGYRTQLDFQIASLPRGLYLSKSMTPRSIKMFRILRQLGHRIAAWDEEGLVHFAPESYYARRLSATALAEVSMLFAWGDENAELYRKYPHYTGAPIHVTGNPRGDLLRAELRGYWEPEAERLRQRYG
ncbi:MAG: surface carbohydrate biosynthesis protein, partial [Myxococcota bacterium]